MTVAIKPIRYVYQANGVTLDWPFYFSALRESDVKLLVGGEEIDFSFYNVDLKTGTLTYPLASKKPVEAGVQIIVCRDTPREQGVDFVNYGGYYPESVEEGLDNLQRQIQELGDGVDRSLKAPLDAGEGADFQMPSPIEPGATIIINEDGTGLAYGTNPDSLVTRGEEAIEANKEGLVTTVSLNINQKDKVLSQSNAGLMAILSFNMDEEKDNIILTGLENQVIDIANISYIANLARQAIADTSYLLNVIFSDGCWLLDQYGNLVPKQDAVETLCWGIDENGTLYPKEDGKPAGFWTFDENGDLVPKISFG